MRFISPVPVGVRLRAGFTLLDSAAKGDATLNRYAVTLEVEGASRPALAAEWLVLLDA